MPEEPSRPAETTAARRPKKSVLLLVLVLGALAATGPLSVDLYLPAFPQIAADLGAPESQIQLTLTAIMIGLAVGQIIIGPMSDAWGRRRPLLIGVAAFTLTSFLIVIVPTVEAFIALRFVQGLAGAAGAVISRAIVRDLFEGDDAARFFSRLMLVVGLAPILAPVLGGQLLLVGSWHLSFVVLGAAGAVSFAAILFGMPESLPAEQRSPARAGTLARNFGGLLRDRRFMGFTLALSLGFSVMFAYISSFPFISDAVYGVSPQTFSLLFGLNSIGLVAATQINGFLIGRVSTERLLMFGLVVAVAGTGGLLLASLFGTPPLWLAIALLFVSVFAQGFVFTNATTLAITSQRPSVAGSASALMGSLQFGLGGTIGALGGVFSAQGTPTMVSMSAVMALGTVAAVTAFMLGSAKRTAKVADTAAAVAPVAEPELEVAQAVAAEPTAR
ncbi:DHA1 family bicyclomycin/chloramphenicol resistance-like MFS transporter [Allonocardiopsis opalescens]|uniref:DHA1 family bicyclomycin/chloramphenicol resistance-like MFS transporter n=1 Tax=Allonocardiopsis opalescens TaxID=1144618 RepID=A0A2T0Q0B2_9ACTN|nr:Bcr/CflA family multidrug efflux MFS transporter [Allonocardiopsis opalescens]PRX97206.1 DHA1 family bicyclomycin/chloramphenicol resistance-like MFS transporter [Allonocardiopsis opalescens]